MRVVKEDMKMMGEKRMETLDSLWWILEGRVQSGRRGTQEHAQDDEAVRVVRYLDGAVDSSGEEASPGDGQSRHAPLMSEQRLCTDHVVHAPHLDNTNTSEGQIL